MYYKNGAHYWNLSGNHTRKLFIVNLSKSKERCMATISSSLSMVCASSGYLMLVVVMRSD
jgi:hypothetical protein